MEFDETCSHPEDGVKPAEHVFRCPHRREEITLEPEAAGTHPDDMHADQDWIGSAQQGGGYVPDDYEWTSNPKQLQDEAEGG